ncbi:MAG TPA: DoxX family protein [Longimicrobium sp.]|jgi:putative oxidoreductase|uniref:DoxX family protein n=1 Tax=Longimicrobium sp. TaxID=2029185 RepID=UPI002ED9508E
MERTFFMARFEGVTLLLLRVMAGLMFMQHGAQKLFGQLGGWRGEPGNTAPLMSQAGLAGVLEVFGGLLIVLGLFTRPVAFLLSGMMAVAYFQAHAPESFWPILNGGELAALYCFVFLFFSARGAGPYSIDARLEKRRNAPTMDFAR